MVVPVLVVGTLALVLGLVALAVAVTRGTGATRRSEASAAHAGGDDGALMAMLATGADGGSVGGDAGADAGCDGGADGGGGGCD